MGNDAKYAGLAALILEIAKRKMRELGKDKDAFDDPRMDDKVDEKDGERENQDRRDRLD